MELCGIPVNEMIDKSRKKDYYFDVDYSPFLIEDEELGILRIPESKRLEEIISCQDPQFVDFIRVFVVFNITYSNVFSLILNRDFVLRKPWSIPGLKKG